MVFIVQYIAERALDTLREVDKDLRGMLCVLIGVLHFVPEKPVLPAVCVIVSPGCNSDTEIRALAVST